MTDGIDWLLEKAGIEREDESKDIAEDIKDSLSTALFNIDNVIEEIDERMDRVDRKLDKVEETESDARETLNEVEDKLDEIDIRIGILEFKMAGAVIIGLVYLAIISAQEGRMYVSYSAAGLSIIFGIETLITLYRGFFGDFLVSFISKIEDKL